MKKQSILQNQLSQKTQKIREYIIQEPIGRGGFGSVYKCQNERDNNLYAIKICKMNEKNIFYYKEVQALNQLNHNNIIKMKEYFLEGKSLACIILEICNQGNLEEYLYQQKKYVLKEKEALAILKGIVDGLKVIHEANFIHRDLKLKNILIHDKQPKICDFGVCKVLLPGESASNQCGTVQYMSPQLILRQPYNSKSDIWSLGVILFRILFGSYPFGKQKEDILLNQNKLLQQEFVVPPQMLEINNISSEIKEVFKNVFKYDQQSRWDVNQLKEFIENYIDKNEQHDKMLKFYKIETQKLSKKYNFSNANLLTQRCQTIKLQKILELNDFSGLPQVDNHKPQFICQTVSIAHAQGFTNQNQKNSARGDSCQKIIDQTARERYLTPQKSRGSSNGSEKSSQNNNNNIKNFKKNEEEEQEEEQEEKKMIIISQNHNNNSKDSHNNFLPQLYQNKYYSRQSSSKNILLQQQLQIQKQEQLLKDLQPKLKFITVQYNDNNKFTRQQCTTDLYLNASNVIESNDITLDDIQAKRIIKTNKLRNHRQRIASLQN